MTRNPTSYDARMDLFHQRLVRLCKQHGVGLRQTYVRVGPCAGRAVLGEESV